MSYQTTQLKDVYLSDEIYKASDISAKLEQDIPTAENFKDNFLSASDEYLSSSITIDGTTYNLDSELSAFDMKVTYEDGDDVTYKVLCLN